MPSLMPSSVCADGPPRQTRMSGSASSIWRKMKGRQIPLSCGVGVRFPDGRHHAIEQLAGAADERKALQIFVAPRCYPDEHQPRLRIAVRENQLGGGRLQGAPVEMFQD